MIKLKEQPKIMLRVSHTYQQESLEEESLVDIEDAPIPTEEEARTLGVIDNLDGVRIARTSEWEIWVEPLNFVLRENSKNSYYSNFGQLLERLYQNRVKFWLTEEKWVRVEIAVERATEDMSSYLLRIDEGLKFLENKFGIHRTFV